MKKLLFVVVLALLSVGVFAEGENARTSGSAPETCCKTGHCGNGMPLCSGMSQKRVSFDKAIAAGASVKKKSKASNGSRQ